MNIRKKLNIQKSDDDIKLDVQLSVSTNEPAIAEMTSNKNESLLVCNIIPGYFANGPLQMPGGCNLNIDVTWSNVHMREGETVVLKRVIKGPMSEPYEAGAIKTDPGTSWNVKSS